MKDIKVIVATHKKYKMPKDPMYIPIHVGAEGKQLIGYITDNTGDNISKKNASFCELTGLYWAWKNLDAQYIGLAHYRRHFKGKNKGNTPFEKALTLKEADKLLDSADVIVTKRRNYYIENVYSHFDHTLYIETLDAAKKIIEKDYPEYIPTFNQCMKRTYMHAFNMFIMKKEDLDKYCSWVFDILFKVEDELKDKKYNAFHSRYPGRVSEVLLDVWLTKNNYTYKEVPFIYTEKINHIKKGIGFLKAKFFKKKYEGSF